MSTFLQADDVVILTGRKNKSLQIQALQKMRIPFWVNAIGKPVIALAAVEGRKEPTPTKGWVMPD